MSDRLETVPFGSPTAQRPPLLLIHGAYCGAWVWRNHFIPYFEEKGWHGIAMSLRGHGQSDGFSTLDMLGIHDFVDDAEAVLHTMDRLPVVVGHSMGGIIAQVLAARREVAGQVLMAAVPPHGLAAAAQHMWYQDPSLLSQLGVVLTLGGWSINPNKLSDSLFSHDTPLHIRNQYLSLFQRESSRSAFEIMIPQVSLPPDPVPPTLVLGGDNDPFIPAFEIERTGRFWDATAHVIPGMPHAVMLDARWEMAAKPIVEWLEQTYPGY